MLGFSMSSFVSVTIHLYSGTTIFTIFSAQVFAIIVLSEVSRHCV